MLDHEDLKWIATTSTDLHSLLQQISRYSDLARQNKGQSNYVEMLDERVELATKTAQALFDRVTSAIIEGNINPAERTKPSRTPFSVVQPLMEPPEQVSAILARARAMSAAPAPMPVVVSKGIPPEIAVLNPTGKRELILLVDDEAEIVELAAQMLADQDYRVVMAKDGFEALKIYQQIGDEIGLVILDFFLPIMDGDAVFDELRSLNPNVNVVLSSGFAEQSKLGTMLAQGLRGFIPKPYTSKKLLDQVRSILDSGRDE